MSIQEMPFTYTNVTLEELDAIPYAKHAIINSDGTYFVGTSNELVDLAEKLIIKPVEETIITDQPSV